jgi:hypothetical protein
MTIMEDAAILRGMAEKVPTAQIRQMQQDLLELIVRIRAILGSVESADQSVIAAGDRLGIRLESAAVACTDFAYTINKIADSFEQIGS